MNSPERPDAVLSQMNKELAEYDSKFKNAAIVTLCSLAIIFLSQTIGKNSPESIKIAFGFVQLLVFASAGINTFYGARQGVKKSRLISEAKDYGFEIKNGEILPPQE